jgi:hypothetical protein
MEEISVYRIDFLSNIIFSDEATFHSSGIVSRLCVRVWGLRHLHETIKLSRDSQKVNVFRALSANKVYGPLFFVEQSVTGTAYVDMMELRLEEDHCNTVFFRQDGAPSYFHRSVTISEQLSTCEVDWQRRCGALGPRI